MFAVFNLICLYFTGCFPCDMWHICLCSLSSDCNVADKSRQLCRCLDLYNFLYICFLLCFFSLYCAVVHIVQDVMFVWVLHVALQKHSKELDNMQNSTKTSEWQGQMTGSETTCTDTQKYFLMFSWHGQYAIWLDVIWPQIEAHTLPNECHVVFSEW